MAPLAQLQELDEKVRSLRAAVKAAKQKAKDAVAEAEVTAGFAAPLQRTQRHVFAPVRRRGFPATTISIWRRFR